MQLMMTNTRIWREGVTNMNKKKLKEGTKITMTVMTAVENRDSDGDSGDIQNIVDKFNQNKNE